MTAASISLPNTRTARLGDLPALAPARRPHATAPLPALAALALIIPMSVVMVLASSLIGPFIVGLIPLMLLFGFAIGPLVAMVKGEL